MSDVIEAAIPLARLFAMAYRYLVESLHERLRALGWDDVRPAFGFALLAAREAPTTTGELANLMGITKQAASKLAATMIEAGYLVQSADAEDGRRRPLVLSPRGARLLADVEDIYRDLEAEWTHVVGARDLKRLRSTLRTAIVSVHEGELPPVRPTW